ncbi:hypothetical protein FQN53_006741 [Emmonsiellopsis sp. PD_33]|nr:hypothetical protein FQN53_006741 [Emmonsiellopsis sp. PD_33]
MSRFQDLHNCHSPPSCLIDFWSGARRYGHGKTEYAQVLHIWNNFNVAFRATMDEPDDKMYIKEFSKFVWEKRTDWVDRFASSGIVSFLRLLGGNY